MTRDTAREMLRLVVAYGKTERDDYYRPFEDHFGVEVVALNILALRGGRNSRFDGPHSWSAGLKLTARSWVRPFCIWIMAAMTTALYGPKCGRCAANSISRIGDFRV
jgi:hypothetical protein